MRTPGRCTNHEACWLANGGRDIWVAVGDEFECPVCASPLSAPPLYAISARSLAVAATASVALVALAGGAGFGLMRALEALPGVQQVAVQAHAPSVAAKRIQVAHVAAPAGIVPAKAPEMKVAQAAPESSVTSAQPLALIPPPRPETVAAALAAAKRAPVVVAEAAKPVSQEAVAPAHATETRRVAQAEVPVPAVRRIAPRDAGPVAPVRAVLTRDAAAAVRPDVVLPILAGGPKGPEDYRGEKVRRWHHRSLPVRRNEILPAPGWTDADEDTMNAVSRPYDVVQGDSDDAGYVVSDSGADAPAQQGDVVPTTHADGTGVYMGGGMVPAMAPQVMPQFGQVAGAQSVGDVLPEQVSRLTVPAMRAPVELPAARVEPASADAVDDAPDAPVRLARLPAAVPAKLVVPEYPPAAEEMAQPGRVGVGCTITVRGEPSDCAVTHRSGGHGFAESVLNWLHSGEVRYRPHLVHGQPVPEAHKYDVKFVP